MVQPNGTEGEEAPRCKAATADRGAGAEMFRPLVTGVKESAICMPDQQTQVRKGRARFWADVVITVLFAEAGASGAFLSSRGT
jgi:hypothetical protein